MSYERTNAELGSCRLLITSLGMLNKSEIHWNKSGTTSLVNNFDYSMNA